MSIRKIVVPSLVLFIVGCGTSENYLGSVSSTSVRGERTCIEFTVAGDVNSTQLDRARRALQASPGYSNDRCSQAGVNGVCAVNQNRGGVSVNARIFMANLGAGAARAQTECRTAGGTWSAR